MIKNIKHSILFVVVKFENTKNGKEVIILK